MLARLQTGAPLLLPFRAVGERAGAIATGLSHAHRPWRVADEFEPKRDRSEAVSLFRCSDAAARVQNG
jgi:hypothetical protein